MNADFRKVLLNIVYYSLVAVMVSVAIFFMVTLANAGMALWERVALYLLTGFLVCSTVYDIVCTLIQSQKYLDGFILYLVSMCTVVVTLIMFGISSTNGRLLIGMGDVLFRLVLFTYIINALAIVVYCIGLELSPNKIVKPKSIK